MYSLSALQKYWQDIPYEVLVGTNTSPSGLDKFNVIDVPSKKSNWRFETLEQLSWIRNNRPRLTHLIVMLDDFVLMKSVNNKEMIRTIGVATSQNLKYIRLKKIDECILTKVKNKLSDRHESQNIACIRDGHPYQSSLQISLWDIGHFENMVKKSESIWDFERRSIPGTKHHTVRKDIFIYVHIVEKGLWDLNAKSVCMAHLGYFEPGRRLFQRRIGLSYYKRCASIMLFPIFGYLSSRIIAFLTRKPIDPLT
jgi:hypothetical protein